MWFVNGIDREGRTLSTKPCGCKIYAKLDLLAVAHPLHCKVQRQCTLLVLEKESCSCAIEGGNAMKQAA